MPVDPETLNNLMLSTAELNAHQQEWVDTYGFAHICRCDEDYATENVGEVTQCWAKMAEDALETCRLFRTALGRIAGGEIDDPVMYASEFLR